MSVAILKVLTTRKREIAVNPQKKMNGPPPTSLAARPETPTSKNSPEQAAKLQATKRRL
jgi:hypothetical protein